MSCVWLLCNLSHMELYNCPPCNDSTLRPSPVCLASVPTRDKMWGQLCWPGAALKLKESQQEVELLRQKVSALSCQHAEHGPSPGHHPKVCLPMNKELLPWDTCMSCYMLLCLSDQSGHQEAPFFGRSGNTPNRITHLGWSKLSLLICYL